MTLLPAADLDIHHIQAIVRAMHELALTDGVHDAERVMLRGFYDECQAEVGALTSFEQLIAAPFDVAEAGQIFDSIERRAALLQSCILLGYADGHYSAGERAKVAAYAAAVSVSAEELAQLEGLVADHLLQQVSRISNVDALKEVASELESR